jgi:hypothetical protein
MMTTTMTTTTATTTIFSHHRPSTLMNYLLAHLLFLDLYDIHFQTMFMLLMTPDSSPPTKPCHH